MGPVRTETLGTCQQDVQLEESESGHFLGSRSTRQTRVYVRMKSKILTCSLQRQAASCALVLQVPQHHTDAIR